MLQRIQTVFLFLVAVLMGLYFMFPVWVGTSTTTGTSHQIFSLFYYQLDGEQEMVQYMPHAVSGILAGLAIMVSLIEIFAYKNRLTQIKLGALNALVLAASLVAALWFANQQIAQWTDVRGQYGIGVFFPVVALVCNMLANRFIRKDEKLVKSMDRIR